MSAGKTVYVELVARTKRFNAGMKKAEKGMARFKKAVGLVSVAILAIGGMALRAVINKVNDLSQSLDKMAKSAKALDVSFAFLEDVQFAFARLGGDGSIGTMTKMFKSLEKATAEAMSGSAEYADLFTQLNLDAKEFGNLKQEEMVLAIHKAYQLSAKSTEDNAAMADILGRGWNKNRAVFAASSEELLRMIDKRRELGGFTEEAGKLGEAFEDVKLNIAQAKRGIGDQVFKAVGPTFIKAAESVERFFIWLQKTGLMGPIVAVTITAISTAMLAAAAAGVTLMLAIAPISLTMLAISALIVGLIAGIGTLVIYWDDLKIAIRDFGDVAGPIMDKLTDFGGSVLATLGFGGNDERAQRASSPPAPRNPYPATGNNGSIVNNYNVTGSTAEQLRADAERRSKAQQRGKRR